MKNYYYNLDTHQASHFANLKTGEKMAIVVPFRKQPPSDMKFTGVINGYALFREIEIGYKLPYPLNARVGLRETWFKTSDGSINDYYFYKSDAPADIQKLALEKGLWRSSQSMPSDAIRYWGIAEDVRVDRVQNISCNVIWDIHTTNYHTICDKWIEDFRRWFNRRYKGKWTWEQNVWCEIMTLRKE